MTLANRLTVVRILLPCVFIPALMDAVPHGKVVALCVFVVGIATDWLDGVVARRYKCASDFGRLMDPLADKILIVSALVGLVEVEPHIVRAWMVVIIVSREFAVTGLRLLAMQSQKIISAEALGKHKTAWQMIGIGSLLSYYACIEMTTSLPESFNHWIRIIGEPSLIVLFWLVTALTLVSGVHYLWRYRVLYVRHM